MIYIRLSLGNRVAPFLGKSSQLCLRSVHFVADLLHLSIFAFSVGGLAMDLTVSVPEFSYLLLMSVHFAVFTLFFVMFCFVFLAGAAGRSLMCIFSKGNLYRL